MAVNLDRLMNLRGVFAAGEFGPDGFLVAYKGPLSEEHAAMTALMCAANNLMLRMQAEGFSRYTGMQWTPLRGWAVAAGDYAVCVMGNAGVFVKSDEADFNQIFRELGQEAGVL